MNHEGMVFGSMTSHTGLISSSLIETLFSCYLPMLPEGSGATVTSHSYQGGNPNNYL